MDATSSFESVPARILQVAARSIGGEQRLAEALQVQPMQLACWLGTLQKPPRSVLLRAVAILLQRGWTDPRDPSGRSPDRLPSK